MPTAAPTPTHASLGLRMSGVCVAARAIDPEVETYTETLLSLPDHAVRPVAAHADPTTEVRAALACTEAVLRLAIARPHDANLSDIVPGIRASLQDLRASGVVGPAQGRFPLLLLLEALVAILALLREHPDATPGTRPQPFTALLDLLPLVRGPPCDELRSLLVRCCKAQQVDSTEELRERVLHVAENIPFEFPSQVRSVLRCANVDSPEPQGLECSLPRQGCQYPFIPKRRRSRSPELIADPRQRSVVQPRADADQSQQGERRRQNLGWIVDSQEVKPQVAVHSASTGVRGYKSGNHASGDGRAAEGARVAYACESKYHRLYSSPSKHGSRGCQFCSTCHMMEFLFNGNTRNCVWNHKPTERKVNLSLSRFSNVRQIALLRLEEAACGRVLNPMEVPL